MSFLNPGYLGRSSAFGAHSPRPSSFQTRLCPGCAACAVRSSCVASRPIPRLSRISRKRSSTRSTATSPGTGDAVRGGGARPDEPAPRRRGRGICAGGASCWRCSLAQAGVRPPGPSGRMVPRRPRAGQAEPPDRDARGGARRRRSGVGVHPVRPDVASAAARLPEAFGQEFFPRRSVAEAA